MTIDSTRFARVKQLFEQAIDLTVEEQTAFLSRECADDESLLAEVRELLGHDAASTAAALPDLARVRVEVAAQSSRQHDLLGKRIGPYEIREQIGQGGMGTVYLAVRTTDFESRVAIKVIRPEAANDVILQRFRDEIRFQASLGQHPSIAAMLDAGESDDGLPYFVMEYVDGVRIDEYCDKRRLTTRQRVELFRRVCGAVQFAHQNAVLHRDLKPSNVLVTSDGVPVLIDFGIAKHPVVDTDVADHDHTQTAYPVFTPDYASPEQIRGARLTTASDVYSLGVIFYELLTGHRPYHVGSHWPHRMAEAIDQQSPPRPSDIITRIETVKSSDGTTQRITPDTISHSRAVPVTRLQRTLRGDLDTITLMALRKEPERRYATAIQFSSDLQRYLDGLPVLAQRDTWVYRTKKLVARNAVAVALTALMLLSLVGGMIGTGLSMADARHQRDDAEQSLATALDAVDRMLLRVGNDDLVDVPQMAHVRQKILEDAVEFYDSFIQQRGDDQRVTYEVARAHLLLGKIYEKLLRLDDALLSYNKSADLLRPLVASGQGDGDAERKLAQAIFGRAMILTRQKEFDEAERAFRRSLSVVEAAQSTFPTADDLVDDATLTKLMLAQVVAENSPREGEVIYREALAIQKALVARRPDVLEYRDTLSSIYTDLSALLLKQPGSQGPAEAESLQVAAFAIRKQLAADHPQQRRARSKLVSAYDWLGHVYLKTNRYHLAIETYDAASAAQRKLTEEFPGYPHQWRKLASLYNNKAVAQASLKQFAAANATYQIVIDLLRNLVADHPDIPENHEDLAKALRSKGHVNNQLSDNAAAEKLFAEELEITQYLVDNFPQDPSYREDLVVSLAKLADRQERAGQAAEAARTYERSLRAGGHNAEAFFHRGRNFARKRNDQRAIEDFTKAIELDATQPDYFIRRAESLRRLEKFEQAIRDYNIVIQKMPADASAFRRRGSCYRDLEQYEQALADYARAIELKPDYATAHNSRGVAFEKLNRLDEAIASYTTALEFAPNDPVVWDNRATIYLRQKKWQAAVDDLTEALKLQDSPKYTEARAYAKRQLGQYESAINDYTTALAEDAAMLDAVHGRAWTYAQIQNWEAAAEDYARAMALSENSPHIRYEQSLVWLAQQQTERFQQSCRTLVAEFVEQASRDGKPPPSVFSKVVIAAAAVSQQDTDWNTLIGLLRQRVETYPDDRWGYLAMSAAMLRNGQTDQATVMLEKTASASDDSADDVRAIAQCFHSPVRDADQLDWPQRVIVEWAKPMELEKP